MKKIENVELDKLVEEAQAQLFEEDRARVAGMVKQALMRVGGLKIELNDVNKQKAKLEEKLAKAEDRLSKLRLGDWSVLEENESK